MSVTTSLIKDNALDSISNALTVEVKRILTSQDKTKRYRRYPLKKKRGGVRWITEPVPALKNLQNAICWGLKIPQVTYKGYSVINGFIPGKSIIDNARPHVGKKVVLSMDLKDFFGSINYKDLRSWSHGKPRFQFTNDQAINTWLKQACFLATGGLPQGSPCSPLLANWAAIEGDEVILRMLSRAKEEYGYDLDYTRYADDLTFSGENIPQSFVDKLVNLSGAIFGIDGIEFAPDKIKFMRSHKRQIVTGIVVNKKLNIPKERRRTLRAIKHRIQTKGIDSVDNFTVEELLGECSYLNLTEQQKARDLIQLITK